MPSNEIPGRPPAGGLLPNATIDRDKISRMLKPHGSPDHRQVIRRPRLALMLPMLSTCVTFEEEFRDRLLNAAGGHCEAGGWLIERFTPLLSGQARSLRTRIPCYLDAEDLVGETWVRVLGSPLVRLARQEPGLKPYQFLSYLALTMWRISLRFQRQRQALAAAGHSMLPPGHSQVTKALEGLFSPITTATRMAMRSEDSLAIERAMAELSDEDREVLLLRGIEGRSNAEVAARLGISRNTASKRYGRALGRLAEALGDRVGVIRPLPPEDLEDPEVQDSDEAP